MTFGYVGHVWNVGTMIFALVAILVVVVPITIAIVHSQRHGHVADRTIRTPDGLASSYGLTICPTCTAVVADQAVHDASVHPGTSTESKKLVSAAP